MLEAKIEAILFISAKPISMKKLAEFLEVKVREVEEAVARLIRRYDAETNGLRLVRSGSEVQMMTSPDHTKLVREFVKDEFTGELTKPQLETLTVIAYRQPIMKIELEQIRGINCSLILRNLALRGLIEIEEAKTGPTYRVSHEFIRFIGLSEVSQLPDYEKLHNDDNIQTLLNHNEVNDQITNSKSQINPNVQNHNI